MDRIIIIIIRTKYNTTESGEKMSLKDVDLKHEYRSFKNDIIRDFYIPVLNRSKEYKRAVGFFSASGLIEISKGISLLVKKWWEDEITNFTNID